MSRRRALLARMKKKKPKKRRRKSRKPRAIYDKNEVLELRSFQKTGVRWIEKKGFRAILADAQGTGKTIQAISVIGRNNEALVPVLVICPSSVVWNWERELKRWLSGVSVAVIEAQSTMLDRGHVSVCSWDMMFLKHDELMSVDWQFIIADEAHYVKNPLSKRSEAFSELAFKCPHLLLMTGTPLVNNEMEFDVLRAYVDGEQTPILRRILEDVDKSVPNKNRIQVAVQMPPDIRREYIEIKDQFEFFIESYLRKVEGQDADLSERLESLSQAQCLAKLTYLRRLLGRCKVPSVAEWAKKMVNKGESVVIFGEHKDVLDMLCDALSQLRLKHLRYDGATSRMNRQIAIDSFQLGKIPILVCSKSACEGITLTKSANLAFLELYWTPASTEQAEDRIHRMGQKRVSNIWSFVVSDSYDERIVEILESKRRIIAQVLPTESVETEDHSRVFRPPDGVIPTLVQRPTYQQTIPKLPPRRVLKAVIFDPYSWSRDKVERCLKRRGYKVRKIIERDDGCMIDCRSSAQFARPRYEKTLISEGFVCVIGQPVKSESQRVMGYR